jgi:hypothetical protein
VASSSWYDDQQMFRDLVPPQNARGWVVKKQVAQLEISFSDGGVRGAGILTTK